MKTLVASKPKSTVLEFGTGIGLSLAWMIEGLDAISKLISVDNDPKLIEIANEIFGTDNRVKLVRADRSKWIKGYNGDKFDLIFAGLAKK